MRGDGERRFTSRAAAENKDWHSGLSFDRFAPGTYARDELNAAWTSFGFSREAALLGPLIEDAQGHGWFLGWSPDDPKVSDVVAIAWPGGRNTPDAGNPKHVRAFLAHIGVRFFKNVHSLRYHVVGLRGFNELTEEAVRALWLKAHSYGLKPKKEFFTDVILDIARQDQRHPLKEYLARVQTKWDGKPRLDTWLIDYLGAEDTLLNRAFSRIIPIAGVRRIRTPGIKFDTLPVLISDQGTGKSSAVLILANGKLVEPKDDPSCPDYFADTLTLGADSKHTIEQTSGKWLIEISELQGSSRETEAVKAMLSRTHDRARLAWDRTTSEVPRQFMMIATTNNREFLRDHTGNPRYWPVGVGTINLDALKDDRDQLWGEAAAREAVGESITLPKELWKDAAEAQRERELSDPITDAIAAVVRDNGGEIDMDTLYDIIGLDHENRAKREQKHLQAIGRAMTKLGWKKKRSRENGGRQYWYEKRADLEFCFETSAYGEVERKPMGATPNQKGQVVRLNPKFRRKASA